MLSDYISHLSHSSPFTKNARLDTLTCKNSLSMQMWQVSCSMIRACVLVIMHSLTLMHYRCVHTHEPCNNDYMCVPCRYDRERGVHQDVGEPLAGEELRGGRRVREAARGDRARHRNGVQHHGTLTGGAGRNCNESEYPFFIVDICYFGWKIVIKLIEWALHVYLIFSPKHSYFSIKFMLSQRFFVKIIPHDTSTPTPLEPSFYVATQ